MSKFGLVVWTFLIVVAMIVTAPLWHKAGKASGMDRRAEVVNATSTPYIMYAEEDRPSGIFAMEERVIIVLAIPQSLFLDFLAGSGNLDKESPFRESEDLFGREFQNSEPAEADPSSDNIFNEGREETFDLFGPQPEGVEVIESDGAEIDGATQGGGLF